MRRTRLALLSLLTLALWLIVPTLAFASGSQPIPPVTPIYQGQEAPYTGLLFPEQAARINDAQVEAALAKVALYERALADLRLTLEATEARLVIAKDSTDNLRDLVPRIQAESYKAGFSRGRQGLGAFVGWDLVNNEGSAGVGYVYRF